MARFDNGWVKLYRVRYDHWLEKDGMAWAVLMKLIAWANYEDSSPNAKIKIKRGQCVTSSYELAKVFKVDRARTRRALDTLQERTVIHLESNLHGTVITILNYDKYQTNEKETTNTKTYEQPTNDLRTTYEQPINKEVKTIKKQRIKEANTLPSASPSGSQEFIARYCEVYKDKYTTNPVIDGRTAAIAKRIVQSIGREKAMAMIEIYLQMNDQWFITKSHDLQSFEGNLNKVELFKETGIKITQSQAKQVELIESNRSVFKDYLRNKGDPK